MYAIRDSDDRDLVRFLANGDMIVIDGRFYSDRGTSMPAQSTGVSEFVIKNGAQQIVALVPRVSGENRDMLIRGSLTQGVTSLAADGLKSEFVIQTSTQVLAIIDEDGNMKIRGSRYAQNYPH